MTNSQVTSRIVIAVGLALVFGAAVWTYMVPAKQGTHAQAADNAPVAAAPNDQIAATAANSPAPDTAAPDQTGSDANVSAPSAATASVAPPAVPGPTPADANSGNDANENSASSNATTAALPKHGSRHNAQVRDDPGSSSSSNSSIRVASAASEPSASSNDGQNSVDTAPSAPTVNAAEAAAPEASAGDADSDARIAAQVRSSIASLLPGSNIDVRTTGGVVALTGSVQSRDVVEQLRQAAQQLTGVKQVDTSALAVTNP